jgi:hypothetical protein
MVRDYARDIQINNTHTSAQQCADGHKGNTCSGLNMLVSEQTFSRPPRKYKIRSDMCRCLLGSCFGTPKVSHEEAASAKVVSKRWPKVPFHGASAF